MPNRLDLFSIHKYVNIMDDMVIYKFSNSGNIFVKQLEILHFHTCFVAPDDLTNIFHIDLLIAFYSMTCRIRHVKA
jgi:hypothetical protein